MHPAPLTRRAPRDAMRILFARGLERAPRGYARWAARRAWTGTEYRSDTDLVIEGFPGCGNSYLRAWVHWANGGHTTSHQHSPAILRLAMADRRPLIVVARDPVDAYASMVLRFPEMALWPEGPRPMFRRYPRVYRPVLDRPDHAVVATFEQATQDPAAVLARVNARFGTSFQPLPPEHDHEVMAFLAQERERPGLVTLGTSAPSAERAQAGVQLKAALRDGTYDDVLAPARATYDALVRLSERPD